MRENVHRVYSNNVVFTESNGRVVFVFLSGGGGLSSRAGMEIRRPHRMDVMNNRVLTPRLDGLFMPHASRPPWGGNCKSQ